MISVAILLFPGLGLALLGCKAVAELEHEALETVDLYVDRTSFHP